MTKDTKFNLLEEVHKGIARAYSDSEAVSIKHSSQAFGYWPSAASIIKPETSLGSQYNAVEGSCMRQNYYRMTRQSVTDFPEQKMFDIWEIGNAIEDIYKQRFCDVDGYKVLFPDINNKKLRFQSAKTKLRGEIDILLQHKETGTKFIVEMKSFYGFYGGMDLCGWEAASSAYFAPAYIRKDDPLRTKPPFPKIQNLLQTMLYLEELWDDNVKLAKIIYVARDSGLSNEFDVTLETYNDKRCAKVDGVIIPWLHLEGIHERFALLGQHLESNTLPQQDFVNEYNIDILYNKQLPSDMPTALVVKHLEWKADIDDKMARSKTPASAKQKLNAAVSSVKRDWQCKFCAYLTRCQNDGNGKTEKTNHIF